MASKYDKINKIKAENPLLTWTQAARKAGFSGEWTSYKGKAKPRTGNANAQAKRRANFDQPSTELAGYESKLIQQKVKGLNGEAQMFGLESTQVEHLLDQDDARAIEFGSSGDPSNKLIVTQTEARFKDLVKQKVPSGFSVTLNPAQESVRVIPDKFFDPIADPSSLPGVDIKIGQNIDSIFGSFVKGGTVRFATKGLAGLLPFVGVGFDVLDAKEKTEKAAQTNAPLDNLQAVIANATAATAPIPEPISQSINFAGGMVNFVIDALRSPSNPVTKDDLDFSTL